MEAVSSPDMPQLIQGVSTIDIIALAVILLLGIRSAFRGFVREVMDMAGIIAGLLFAVLFSGLLAPVLESWLGKTPLNQILAFAAIFALTWLLVFMLRDGLQALVDGLELQTLDHALGFVFGMVTGVLIVFLLLFLLNLQQVVPMRPTLAESVAFKLLSPLFGYADQLIVATVPGAAQAAGVEPAVPTVLAPATGGQ